MACVEEASMLAMILHSYRKNRQGQDVKCAPFFREACVAWQIHSFFSVDSMNYRQLLKVVGPLTSCDTDETPLFVVRFLGHDREVCGCP